MGRIEPCWLNIAEKELGQKEVPGFMDNPRVMEYLDTLTNIHADHDEVPWCAAFVNWCLKQCNIKGTDNGLAKSWLTWGKQLDTPELGCICIIKQKQSGADVATGSSTGYHVAFWLSESNDIIHLLGGNQSDQVKMSGFKTASYEVVGYRMPKES